MDRRGSMESLLANYLDQLQERLRITMGPFSQELKNGAFSVGTKHPADRENNPEVIRVNTVRIANIQELIRKTELAQGRLKEGIYGRCRSCETPIPLERLEAVPITDY